MNQHVVGDFIAVRELLASYGVDVHVRVCGAESACLVLVDDERKITRPTEEGRWTSLVEQEACRVGPSALLDGSAEGF